MPQQPMDGFNQIGQRVGGMIRNKLGGGGATGGYGGGRPGGNYRDYLPINQGGSGYTGV